MTKKYKWIEKDIKKIKESDQTIPERLKHHMKQYKEQGWTDTDTWNIDVAFAKWITPRLERFSEINNGFPNGTTKKSWNAIIQKMIKGFKFMASDEYFSCRDPKKFKDIEVSMELFHKHIRDLWL